MTNTELIHLTAEALHERAAYIIEHRALIPVRIERDGLWQNKYLSELEPGELLREAFRLLLRAEVPYRRLGATEGG